MRQGFLDHPLLSRTNVLLSAGRLKRDAKTKILPANYLLALTATIQQNSSGFGMEYGLRSVPGGRKENRGEIMRETLEQIIDLVEQLPGGIDYEAHYWDISPEDMVAHIGGLIWQICQRALKKLTNQERTWEQS